MIVLFLNVVCKRISVICDCTIYIGAITKSQKSERISEGQIHFIETWYSVLLFLVRFTGRYIYRRLVKQTRNVMYDMGVFNFSA